MHQGSPFLPTFRILSLFFHVMTLQPKATFTPSTLTSIYNVPSVHHFHHQHPSSHMILIHSLHVSKSSQYSLIHCTHHLFFQYSSGMHVFIPNQFLTLPQNISHLISKRFTLHLKALLIPNVSVLYNAVCRLYNYFFLKTLLCIYPQSSIAQHTFQCCSCFTPFIHSMYHIPFTPFIHHHLRPQVLHTIPFLELFAM